MAARSAYSLAEITRPSSFATFHIERIASIFQLNRSGCTEENRFAPLLRRLCRPLPSTEKSKTAHCVGDGSFAEDA